jgi:carbonic anhydrase
MTGEPFADVLAANEQYAQGYSSHDLTGRAAKGLAVLTCIDTRIEPLAMLGLVPGDAKILRNAGARVTDEALATLAVARHLLGVERVMVVAHTDCRMSADSPDELHDAIAAAGGPDTRALPLAVRAGREETLRSDVERIRSSPYLEGLEAGGFLYDVRTGRVSRIC